MFLRRRLTAVLMAVTSGLGVSLSAAPAHAASSARLPAPAVSEHSVDEGRVVRVTVKVSAPRTARRVILQRWVDPEWSFGSGAWEPVRSQAVRGRKVVTFKVVATQENRERFRYQMVRKVGPPQLSKLVVVRVWRWISLKEFQPYETVGSPYFHTADVSGRSYPAWGAISRGASWEGRFTAGRNCTTLRSGFGVTDRSEDGSSASVQVETDGRVALVRNGAVPGRLLRISVPLKRAYRFSVVLQDTSGEEISAYPVLVDPELRCTGLTS